MWAYKDVGLTLGERVNTDVVEIVNTERLNWITTLALVVLHIGAVAALFMFSWSGLAVALLLYWVATG